MNRIDAAIGSLLGTAVGDSLGLPMEGLSRDRQRRMFPRIDGQMLLLGRGMCSDDTEHSCMVAQAVAMHGRSETAFAASMRWRLRWWLLALPAGTGFATLRAILSCGCSCRGAGRACIRRATARPCAVRCSACCSPMTPCGCARSSRHRRC